MSEEVIQGLSAESYRIPSKWNRSTVADGSWLQKYTLSPLSARDYYLASAIDSVSGSTDTNVSALSAAISSVSAIHDNKISGLSSSIDYVSGAIDNEISTRINETQYLSAAITAEQEARQDAVSGLQNQIDTMNAATDVIDVYGSWSDFTTNSGNLFTTSAITDNDIIKVINDPNVYQPDLTAGGSHQTYHRWIITATHPHTAKPLDPTEGKWSFIGYTDPYYNIVEIDDIVDDISGTIANTYLSAKNAVHEGKNITVVEDSNNPEITIETKDDVSFTNISSTNVFANSLSATKLSANELSATKLTANELSATTLSAATAYGQSAKFDNISATNLTALTATGESAKYTNVSATNLTALTASGNLAQYITLSGNNIQGNSVSSTIDGLINSALSGGAMTGLKNASVLEFQYQDGSTPAAISAELKTTADKISFLPSSGCTDWLKFSTEGYDDVESAQTIKIITPNFQTQIETLDTKKLDKSAFSNWSGSTASLFSGTSRSAQSAGSASLANSSTYTYSATIASSAGYAETAKSAYSSQSAQNADKLGGVEAAKYMVSTKLYSNTAGVITAYGNADSKSALGCVGDYVEKSARNCTIGSANIIGTGANDAFAQGCGNSAVDRAFVQGQFCVANYVSLAEGLNSSAICTAMAQGYCNSAYEQSLAQGYYNSAATRSIAVGYKNFARDGSCSIGSGNSAYRDGVSMGDENTASFQSLALGTRNSAYSYSLAQGYGNSAYDSSIAQGYANNATNYSQAFGRGTIVSSSGMALGTYNKTTSAAFVIGNGTSDSNRSDLLTVGHEGDIMLPGITDAGGGKKSITFDSTGLSAVSEGRGYRNTYSSTWVDIINDSKGAYVPLSASSCEIGTNNSADDDSFAQGANNYAETNSMAQGFYNSAYSNSFAQGSNNSAAKNSFAWGTNNTAAHDSITMGKHLITKTGQIALGWYGKANTAAANNVIFAIGNGTSTNDRSDAFTLASNGMINSYDTDGKSVFGASKESIVANNLKIPIPLTRGLSVDTSTTAVTLNVPGDVESQNYLIFGADGGHVNLWIGNNVQSNTFTLMKAASVRGQNTGDAYGTYRLAIGVQSGYTIIFKNFATPTANRTDVYQDTSTVPYPLNIQSPYYDTSFYTEPVNLNTHFYFHRVPVEDIIRFTIDNDAKIVAFIKGGVY